MQYTSSRFGMRVLYEGSKSVDSETLVDIVAVHGIGANPDTAWVTSNVNWLTNKDMLPSLIPNIRILQLGYESQWFGNEAIHQRLPLVADQLLHGLLGLRTECMHRPIIFIGHCFGGLVVERALISAKLHAEDFPGVIEDTAGVVFLGTPHRGSSSQSKAAILASIASALHCGEESSLLKAVEKDSEMLRDLLHDFTRTVNTTSIPLFCFFEQHKSDIAKIVKPKGSYLPAYRETLVDENSGCIDGFPKLGLACDHFQINRFSDPQDANFCFIAREIAKFVKKAYDRVHGRLHPAIIAQNTSSINEERDLACINAAFITDPRDDMEKIQNKQDKILEETGSWILSNKSYTKWLNDDSSQLLWLHGDPGKGKTMLAISLVKEMSDRIRLEGSASTIALAYFFCDNKDTRRRSATAILRGIIYQLLCQKPDLCMYLRDSYEKQKAQLFSSPNSLHSLWRIFQDITRHHSLQRTYIILDALDECDSESVESLLTLLEPDQRGQAETPVRNHEVNAKDDFKEVKWLLTSRNEHIFKQFLADSLEIGLEDNHGHVEDAVDKFIDVKVRQLQRRKGYDMELRRHVGEQLRAKAEGTFLWVALACRELSKPSVLSMNTKSVLLKLPPSITALYERIIEQVLGSGDEEQIGYARSILRSMVIALRPLTLYEIAITAGLPDEHRHSVTVLGEYVSQCGSMVAVREHTAYFVHYSAKAFILSMTSGAIMSTDLRADHQFLALNCFEHVCQRLCQDLTRTAIVRGTNTHEMDPEYPMLFWPDHTRQAPMEIADCIDLQQEFFCAKSAPRQVWVKSYWEKVHAKWEIMPADFTALHLAAYTGLSCLIGNIIAMIGDTEIDVLDSLSNTPLLLAAKYGYEMCVEKLLAAAADTEIANFEGMTALHWAARNGYESIVKLLSEKGAKIETRDKNGWTPIHRAAYNGHTSVVRLLLDLGADIEALDGSTWTALHRASSSGQDDVVRLLINRNASIDALDREGMTPMLHAAWAGHHRIMMLHLERQVDINAADLAGWTALHNAAWNGHIAAVDFLLQRNAEVNSRNKVGTTALHNATWSGHAGVAGMLIGAGAETDAKDEEGETPLQQAAWRGHASAIEVLLAAKVEINMTNNVGHTALHQAGSSGQEDVVQLLLKAGANPTLLDKHGQSARALAEANEHDITAGILEAKELDLSGLSERTAVTPVGQTPLDVAVAEALAIDATLSTVQPYQAAGFFVPQKITTILNGKSKYFYMKSGSNKEMFESEFISLTALHHVVPTLAPKPLKWGKFSSAEEYYLVTEWVDVETRNGGDGPGTGLTLAQKVAKLHSVPAPIPEGFKEPAFGFPITTYCGSTPQTNSYCTSWAKFYAENRLRSICRIIQENHGTDSELMTLLEKLVNHVVPKLLGNGRLGGKKGIQPVLLHGDLWEGNKAKGKFDDRDGIEPVTFDPSCLYGHSEFELGIMRMFGGFSAGFFNEYHHLVPKTEPKSQYDDRMSLYELYHYLNHYAIYSGGYKDDVIDSMKSLCAKYGPEEDIPRPGGEI